MKRIMMMKLFAIMNDKFLIILTLIVVSMMVKIMRMLILAMMMTFIIPAYFVSQAST